MKKIISALLSIMLLATSVSVAALDGVESTTDIEVSFQALACDAIANEIHVTGIAGKAEKTVVTLAMTKSSNILYLKQIYTENDGSFSADIILNPVDTSGTTGTLYVSAKNADTRKVAGISLYTQAELDGLLAAYTSIASASEMVTFIDDYGAMFGLADGALSDSDCWSLYTSYVAAPPAAGATLSQVIAHVRALLGGVVELKNFLAEMNAAAHAGDWEEIKDLMQVKYAENIPFSTDINFIIDEEELWMLMTGAEKNYTSYDDVETAFDYAVETQRTAEIDAGNGICVKDDKELDFNSEKWKVVANANLITVSGQTEELGKSEIVIYASDYNVTDPHIIGMKVVTTESDGSFTTTFAVDPDIYGGENKAIVKVGGTNRNVWQFIVDLYDSTSLDAMTAAFKTVASPEDMHSFVTAYYEILGIGSGYNTEKTTFMYEAYEYSDYTSIEYPEEVAMEMTELNTSMKKLKEFVEKMNEYSTNRLAGHMLKAVETDYAELADVALAFNTLYGQSSGATDVSKNGVYLRMIDKTFTTTQSVLDAYNQAYNAQYAFENPTPGDPTPTPPPGLDSDGGGGDGGSGGGGGGGVGSDEKVEIAPELFPETPVEPLDPDMAPVPAFVDLAGYDWAAEAIDRLRQNGLTRGDGDGNYRPADNMTREEFLTMLLKTFHLDIENGNVSFTDVKKGEWYWDTVATAVELGITNGMGDGTFGIGQNIIRADMAVLTARLIEQLDLTVAKTVPAFVFNDFVDIPEYAYNDISNMQQSGFLNGDDYGNYNPMADLTRAEAAVFFWNIYQAVRDAL